LVTALFDKHKRAILEERHERIEIPDFLNAVSPDFSPGG